MIDLPDDGPDGEVWQAVCQLAAGFAGRWCLIGARMVELHGLAVGRTAPRRSADVDMLCDARTVGSRPRDIAAWLIGAGFSSAGISPDGIGHRYRRRDVFVDVLAPDHMGVRADLSVEPGVRTVAVPGGSRALKSVVYMPVRCGDLTAQVPVPSLAGARIAKARAVEVDDVPENQRLDVAFLCSLVDDILAVSAELRPADRQRLARRQELADRDHPAWRALGDDARDAYAAFRYLGGLDRNA